jgi:hypothetical protein
MFSPASERPFQASQSAFTRRQVRLPLIRFAAQPLPTAPRNSAPSAPDPSRVGARQVGRGDQRLHLPGHPRMPRQDRAAPFPRRAVGLCQPRPRHAHADRTERAEQVTLPPAVTMPLAVAAPLVSPPAESRRQLFLQHRLDEAPDAAPHIRLDRVKPCLPGK